ncbi:MAG TPA: class B sortase [Candidatus Onthousia faecipullorum]|uniref:Class B sortase n=1 Tax=Candidatus Onthousia faecipullorum TaxID=2840887 RepID=A0A9D1GCG8_9FIRM|nr:class B sortase [Candidatus Onthousia faecipullorum]
MRKRKWYIILIVSIIIVFILIYNITSYYFDYKKDLELKKELEQIEKYDFDTLKKINQDIVGYIEVKNTNVSYPIVKSSDNSYYLNHSYDKEKNNVGSIFLDYRNDLENLSRNNIIYGHGRLDKSMFGSLNNLLEKDWLSNKDNYYITVTTPNKIMTFKIFSVYTIDKESYYIKTYFSSNKYFKDFLETIMKRSIYNFGTDVNTTDKILTLSTCKNDFGKRIVVHAKLLKKEETS